jgi:hypothetical protein
MEVVSGSTWLEPGFGAPGWDAADAVLCALPGWTRGLGR